MNKSIKGFSLVEIITTTAIIAVLAIIGFTFATNYQANQYNTSRVADITAIYDILQTNYTQNKTFPDPSGNKQYYDNKGTYSHGASGAFGVSGFLTSKTLSRDKMGYPFRDEQTKNYYGYGKRLDGNMGYNIATVLNEKGEYFGYVMGDIGGNRMELAGLVKEYAGPNFVINKNKYLPYNPYEIKLTGRVSVYLGAVNITDGNGNLITSTNILDYEIEKGNIVKVPIGGIAIINLSDGTELRLGSDSEESILDFSELEYTDDSNLFTKVMLNLSLGEIWVKAPELEKESAFIIRNKFMAATVRGTVFGMTTNASSGSVSLIDGKLEVGKLNETGGTTPLFTDSIGTGFSVENGISYMQVLPGEKPIYYNYIETGTPTIGNVGTGKVLEIETPVLKFNSGILPNIVSIDRSISGKLGIKVENMGATSIEIKGTGKEIEDSYSGTFSATDSYFIKNDIPWPNGSNNYSVRLCVNIIEEKQNCTGWATLNTNGTSMSESAIIGLKRASAGFKLECETAMKPFLGFGCQDENLVVYAPYDNIGDLYMYSNSPTVDNKKLEPRTDYVASAKYDGGNYYRSDLIDSDTNISNPNGVTYPTGISGINLWEYSSSFISMNTGDRGVVVFPYQSAYMKYDLTNLNLGDSFSIEMSVRGGALKRSSLNKNFTLFDFGGNNKLVLNTYSLSNKLQLFVNGTEKSINISDFSNLDSNKFYKITASFNVNKFNLEVAGDGFDKLGQGTQENTLLTQNTIYIGSDISNYNQWNDIIDSVKIYK
ncbi:FecR family protein [Candidatus Gracilibacteria bacterium]|nr:FecR family protein [Candidatus Gracilibacteria bacterium]